MIRVVNNGDNEPCVLHFQGVSNCDEHVTFDTLCEHVSIKGAVPSNLSLISCWTDENKCNILKHCRKAGINLINAVPSDYDVTQEWDMRNKIRFICDTLNKIDTEYALILDGYDTFIMHLDDIIQRFEHIGYRILYNATFNNYPLVQIDSIPWRYKLGQDRFLNAGCCIGYTKDLLDFYNKALDYADRDDMLNPFRSEQFIIRRAFAEYAGDPNQKYVFFDYNSIIFQTFGNQVSSVYSVNDDMNDLLCVVNDNIDGDKQTIVITGSDGFIGKHVVNHFYRYKNVDLVLVDTKNGFTIDGLIGLFKIKRVDAVIHLAAQTSVFNKDNYAIERDNIHDFITIANLCHEYGAKLVYASSSTAYNPNTTSMYGLSKRFNEEYAKIYCPYATGVRLHNVYGIGQREGTLLWYCLNNDEVTLYNNGNNRRSFTYIDDVVESIVLAVNCNHQLVNCCSMNNTVTIKEFVEKVANFKNIKINLDESIKKYDVEDQFIEYTLPNLLDEYTSIDDGIANMFKNAR